MRLSNSDVKLRNLELDILKGLAIIVVVAIHAQMPVMKWLQLVQMQMFFIASGFCYKTVTTETVNHMKDFIIRRIRSLYIPCLLWSLAVTITHNALVNVYLIAGELYGVKQMLIKIIKCFLFSGGGQLSGTIWFLRAMFLSTVIYMLIDRIGRRFSNQIAFRWIVCIVLLVVGWLVEYIRVPGNQYFNIFSVLFLYELGRGIRESNISIMYPGKAKKNIVLLGSVIISSILLCFLKKIGGIAVNSNVITNPIFFSVCSVWGWMLFVALSNLIGKVKGVCDALSYMGKHTLPIMLFHFISFKFVTLFQIKLYGLEIEQLGAFPCLISEKGWWGGYTVCGIAIPLLAYIVYHRISSELRRIRQND